MKKRKAQIWDRMEYLSESYNNYHMYCIVDLDGKIDESLLKKALIESFSVFPILKSRFKESAWAPKWIEDEASESNDILSVVKSENSDLEKQKFYEDEIDESKLCQVKAKIIRKQGKDTLCFAMNHMICDAAGFKEYLYVLSDIYLNLEKDNNYRTDYVLDGNRSAVGFYFDFIKRQKSLKKKMEVFFKAQRHNKYEYRIPLADGVNTKPDIATISIDADRFLKIKEYGKTRGATINDMFLTAFYLTVAEYVKEISEDIKIPCMVDLRRFKDEKQVGALYNLTSTLVVCINSDESNSFYEVLYKINSKMENLISDFKALNGYLYMVGMFEAMPSTVTHALIKKLFSNFPIAYSNLGIIDDKKLNFGSVGVSDCFMTGSIKKKPYFWLAFSTFKKKVTISINLDGNRDDFEIINSFLEDMVKKLPE